MIPSVASSKENLVDVLEPAPFLNTKMIVELIFIVSHAIPTTDFDLKFEQVVVTYNWHGQKIRACSKQVPGFWFPNLATMIV